ncbi:hypothetical protein PDESU_04957 [Pontiella desulfatans]|uniref:Uncharacterized protein n=1 Tax=Pontiella desulfatans TaxID=2750659 RepID=A0A6C2UAH8_PONDE|nr:family 43 glycosylhydrolase [Pontiella desulfatans]VGO16366.1 hypothetical protein PDESU_04957 [Pontiella desulfatans]
MKRATACCLAILPIISVAEIFPALIPEEKPDYPVSAAVARLYDQWNPHEDRGNELYSNFKYTPVEGLERKATISRRDPSKVILVDGVYHVWYTCRKTAGIPVGKKATESIPSFDWDLCDLWHATSSNGWNWVEDEKPAVTRLAKPGYGWRSISTTDVLIWEGKYYLYYQGFNEIPGLNAGDRAAVTVAEADSPNGPWKPLGKVVVDFGKEGEWDSDAIHDPYPIIYKGKIYLYYKGSPQKGGRDGTLIRAQGVAIAEHPLGPFKKSPLNPVINSGHETCMFPFKDGVAAIVSLDGAEKNTVQYAPDGINFEVKSLIQIPPVAPGPFCYDAFAGNGDGRGISWGLCHIMDKESGNNNSILARFDCDLSLDVDRQYFKRNNLRFNDETYFQKSTKMNGWLSTQIEGGAK